ncbi:DIS3-like exonuclease 2 isoform X2 [Venturia canescens]|uniref:DIS3-like exonuclease 2 isoform X2 n=1 Tax=Venturia canescens TaxID=32260 RepID=UPI001C9D2DDA|nr:DIS3-like exonuclease 2 isoform X2 [Venturia canescens]
MTIVQDSSSTVTSDCPITSMDNVKKRSSETILNADNLVMSTCLSEDALSTVGSDANKSDVKRKRKRGKRGGRKNKKKNDEPEPLDEIIRLLRSEGFSITPPANKQCTTKLESPVKTPNDSKMLEALRNIMKSHSAGIEKIQKLKKKLAKETEKKLLAEKRIQKIKDLMLKIRKRMQKNTSKCSKTDQPVADKKKDKENLKKKRTRKSESLLGVKKREDEEILTEKKKKNSTKLAKNDNKEKDDNSEGDSKEKSTFPKYIKKKEILELMENQDRENPTYVKGYIRINPKNNQLAYISIDKEIDILVSGIQNRNRALEGDLVAAIINPEDDWTHHESGEIQKTATVMCILEKIHPRKIAGTLDIHKGRLRLTSRDMRVPILFILLKNVPKEVQESPEDYVNTLFVAAISEWHKPHKCHGIIESIMGDVGDLEGETTAILLTNGLDVKPYDEKLLEGLPSNDYVPTAEDLEGREDWRNECVFTIDPATAVDLDDAVSCKKLPNGNFEVGVHISDVTHYLKAFSPLDEEVSKRATTVYLVNTVYHMLPKLLCNVCSLLPGKEKLSFSVVWEMTPEAKVVKHRFAKSVIKSCYQMSYEQAQTIIDESTGEWTALDLMDLEADGPSNDIREVVNHLYKLSTQLRERRFADGAMSINQPKLQILLDQETRIPISYRIEERQESNRLIEEFMLLANMTVAKHLYENMGDTAFLRSHGEPLDRTLKRTTEDLARLGVILNIESAASLQASLVRHEQTGLEENGDEFITNCRMMVINSLVAQSMPRANYLCAGKIEKEEDLKHFALNVPFYTHFTSPIRRYADIVVHRLLESSLSNTPMPDAWSADLCAEIATNCNRKKYSAKIAQEKSNELYFMDLLSRKGPTETVAIVMTVQQRCMYVILCHVGITIKMSYLDLKDDAEYEYNKELSVPTVIIKWKNPNFNQTINVFSIIKLRVEKHPKNYSIRGVLLPTQLDDSTDCV